MRKLLTIISVILFGLTISHYSQCASYKSAPMKESGLTLDIARRFYSVDTIKKFIDTIHQSGGTFIHLHLSDHENYALESHYLNQLEENAFEKGGTYFNSATGKPFLTYKQIDEIIRYAKKKKIEIIPEVDSPNHMTAIFNLLELKHGKEYVDGLKSHVDPNELNITNPHSIEVMKHILAEVIYIFGHSSRHIHIGGDEFGYSPESNHEFIRYVNTLNEFINAKGLTTRIWNDGLIKNNLDQLAKNVQITYWSYDGDSQDKEEASKRRLLRASLPDLLDKGFKVLNYNSYYLYFVPNRNHDIAHDAQYAANDVARNWQLGQWDKTDKTNSIFDTGNIIGSSLSVWGEDSGTITDEMIQESVDPLLRTIIEKTNEPPKKSAND